MKFSIKEIIKKIQGLPEEDQINAINLLEGLLRIDIAKKINSLTGTGVRGFFLENNFHAAESHIDVLRKILEMIVQRFPDKREELLDIQGLKRKYFSKNLNDVSPQCEKIKGTDIYFEKCDNANSIRKRCKEVLNRSGIPISEFEVLVF